MVNRWHVSPRVLIWSTCRKKTLWRVSEMEVVLVVGLLAVITCNRWFVWYTFVKHLQCAQELHVLTRDHTVLLATRTFTHKCYEPSFLCSVSIHQMAPPEWGSTRPITAHYSFTDLGRMKGWVGLVGWPCNGQFTHISGHVSCRSSVGQGKFAGHRPTFYCCATQPT